MTLMYILSLIPVAGTAFYVGRLTGRASRRVPR